MLLTHKSVCCSTGDWPDKANWEAEEIFLGLPGGKNRSGDLWQVTPSILRT